MISITHLSRLRAFCLFLGLAAMALAAPVKFDIPAQAGNTALQLFGRQAAVEVLFSASELKKVQTAEVKGEMEPPVALGRLLAGTGFAAEQTGPKNFVVKKAEAVPTTGSVKGLLVGEGGRGLADVLVAIRETSQSAETNRFGEYVFPKLAAGTYVLVASAAGYQTMHITDVQVRAGRELTLGKEEMRKAKEGPLALEPFVVHADTVTELEKFEVTGAKAKPFSTANVDLPRTIDDVQPYYIFDQKVIERSGAVSVEDLLRNRLTMDATVQSPSQVGPLALGATTPSFISTNSSINLRGLGAEETLILINGRRAAGAITAVGNIPRIGQPDLNGIPLEAIERIEVLPSSASGIYGGNAIGGVINVILKKDYAGGELKFTYNSTFDGHAPSRSAAATFGQALEGGRTHYLVTAKYADTQPLYVGDRVELLTRGYGILQATNPNFGSASTLYGAQANIRSLSGPLTFKGSGTSLGSAIATLPPGGSVASPASYVAGAYNTEPSATDFAPNGLYLPLGSNPQQRSLRATLERQMTPWLQLFGEFNYSTNETELTSNPYSYRTLRLTNARASNPFNQTVIVTIPIIASAPTISDSKAKSLSLGAKLNLPASWKGEMDYTWSQSAYRGSLGTFDVQSDAYVAAISNDPDMLSKGFVDLSELMGTVRMTTEAVTEEFAARASGPLVHLPWRADIVATVGLSHRKESNRQGNKSSILPQKFAFGDQYTTYYPTAQTDDSGYLETTIPLVNPAAHRRLLAGLDLQLAGRVDKYAVDTGTFSKTELIVPNGASVIQYSGPVDSNGNAYRAKASYSSHNYTTGIIYRVTDEVYFRASYASAFLPPTYLQLLPDAVPAQTTITDPKNPSAGLYPTSRISGGNPALKPQSSRSKNLGFVWAPQKGPVKGVRLNVEYYETDQKDAITSPSAQFIVNNELLYASRVTRDAATNLITLVDASALNLFEYRTAGWDVSLDYQTTTRCGAFDLHLAGTRITHNQRQLTANSPLVEYAGFPNSGGVAEKKGVGSLTWEPDHHWSFAWTVRYFGSYNQVGAPGEPSNFTTQYLTVQGANTIPSQTYHDLFVSYAFGRRGTENKSALARVANRALDDLTIQIGVKNIFDRDPPFDVYYFPYYYSPYGDIRLRDLWVSVKKSF